VNAEDDFAEPVHDIEAERYTLAAMMMHPSAIEAAAMILGEDSFYRPAHQAIFHALVAMMVAGEHVDPMTLSAWLRSDGDGKALGADGLYVAGLYSIPAAPQAVESYAGTVLKCAARRAVIGLGTRMISAARVGDVNEAELVGRGHDLLDQVLTAGGSSTVDMPGMTADEFCDADDINAEPLIPGLLYKMERLMVVGPEGSGKSILGLQAAFTAAAGVHPFQHQVSIDPLKVLVVDLENPPHIVQRRFRTFRSIAANYPGWDGKNLTLLHKPGGLDLTSPRHAYGMAQAIKRSGAQLVVAGPVYKMMWGIKVDLEVIAQLAAFWDRMREDHGITLWLENHAPYGAGGGKREMRPEGSNLWAKWCEFGVSLNWAVKAHGGKESGLDWTYFKGQREEGRAWPSWITRDPAPGRTWPWKANYEPGFLPVAPRQPAIQQELEEARRYGD
jgi:replicative DNA helicase